MKKYVAGFYFDANKHKVALVLKQKPPWQRDKYNAIGGKIEPGETPEAAIKREFQEETGVVFSDWKLFLELCGDSWKVYFFSGVGDPQHCRTCESEPIHVVNTLLATNLPNLIPNLYWILPMALDANIEHPVTINYRSETL